MEESRQRSVAMEYWNKELEKCKNSIEYFYETYCLVDGKKPVMTDKIRAQLKSLQNYGRE